MAFKFTDLDPSRPLAFDAGAPEFYADGIGTVEALGANFRTTYFTWGAGPDGIIRRIPVVRVVRPLASIIGVTGGGALKSILKLDGSGSH